MVLDQFGNLAEYLYSSSSRLRKWKVKKKLGDGEPEQALEFAESRGMEEDVVERYALEELSSRMKMIGSDPEEFALRAGIEKEEAQEEALKVLDRCAGADSEKVSRYRNRLAKKFCLCYQYDELPEFVDTGKGMEPGKSTVEELAEAIVEEEGPESVKQKVLGEARYAYVEPEMVREKLYTVDPADQTRVEDWLSEPERDSYLGIGWARTERLDEIIQEVEAGFRPDCLQDRTGL